MNIGELQRTFAADGVSFGVGWKVWHVERADDRVRLRSVLYGSLWPPARPAVAECKRIVREGHEAPHPLCDCGIHAAAELEPWRHYLRVGAESRVFGRVLLWGALIEGTQGWRGAMAYPVSIFVPPRVLDAAAVADGLGVYGVSVAVAEWAAALEIPELAQVRS
jgi:hypothetical protein